MGWRLLNGPPHDDRTIVVDHRALLRFLQYESTAFQPEYFEQKLNALPAQERRKLVEQYVREEALVRAAAGNEGPDGRLEPIPGVPPVLHRRSADCAFAARCRYVQPMCRAERPADIAVEGRVVACHFARGGLGVSATREESA